MSRIAAGHPGKHGDALYAIPVLRALAERHGQPIDFYTSPYCEPLRTLFEAQECVDNFYVAPNYKLERMDMGCQPYYVPIDGSMYDAVYQLGYRGIPDCSLPEYIGKQVGVTPKPVSYDLPEIGGWVERLPSEYYVLAPRGKTSFDPLFQELFNASYLSASALPFVLVGSESDCFAFDVESWNKRHFCGFTYLETAQIIQRSKGFVGISSSQLVLANGFPIPRVCVHDGKSWNQDHWIRSEWNHYPVNPTTAEVLAILERNAP